MLTSENISIRPNGSAIIKASRFASDTFKASGGKYKRKYTKVTAEGAQVRLYGVKGDIDKAVKALNGYLPVEVTARANDLKTKIATVNLSAAI
jgi:hypothetical protein